MKTKQVRLTPEERRMDRELRRYVRTLDMESKAVLLLIARERARSGEVIDTLFRAQAI
jgi:hypothetical protein